jgi:hypothetical protein
MVCNLCWTLHAFPTYIFIVDWLKNQVKECHIFFLKPMASIYKTSYIYVVIFCWMSLSDYSPISVSSSFPKINCWTFFITQQECQMQICMESICGSIWCLLMNQFNIPLNSLNLCQHRIGRHRDIAGMYHPMLLLV